MFRTSMNREAPAGPAPDRRLRVRGSHDARRLRLCVYHACLYLAPVVAVVAASGQYRYGYWIVSCGCLAAWIVMQSLRDPPRRALACMVSGGTAAANGLLAVSFHIQGTGFNDPFFAHLDAGTLGWIADVYAVEAAVAALWWVMVTALPAAIAVGAAPADDGLAQSAVPVPTREPRSRWRLAVTAAGLGGVLTWAPGLSLLSYTVKRIAAADAPTVMVRPAAPDMATAGGDRTPNLILVIAESLEASYADPALVGSDLTPELSRLERGALRFTAMEQIAAASWTMGGLVAAQCALPLEVPAHWIAQMVRTGFAFNPMNRATAANGAGLAPGAPCLADILSRLGYRTVFMNGVSLRFAGLGAFLAAHGFGERLGADELAASAPDPAAWGPWGLHDDVLLGLARRRIEVLERADEPYALVLLTIDTHDSAGNHTSRSCGPKPLARPMRAAVRCADRLVARFIEALRARWPDTVVALMSDHLTMPNRIFPDPARPGDGRRPRFAIWSADHEPREIDRPGTHLDIAPTLLDAMGFEAFGRHHAGASLLRFPSFWLSHPDPESLSLSAAHALTGLCVAPGAPVVFDPQGPMIEVGGQRLLATGGGFDLRESMFTLRFGADGCLETVPDPAGTASFAARERGRLVVGLSTDPEFNRSLGQPGAALAWFAGPFGTPGMRTGPVIGRTSITMGELPHAPVAAGRDAGGR